MQHKMFCKLMAKYRTQSQDAHSFQKRTSSCRFTTIKIYCEYQNWTLYFEQSQTSIWSQKSNVQCYQWQSCRKCNSTWSKFINVSMLWKMQKRRLCKASWKTQLLLQNRSVSKTNMSPELRTLRDKVIADNEESRKALWIFDKERIQLSWMKFNPSVYLLGTSTSTLDFW